MKKLQITSFVKENLFNGTHFVMMHLESIPPHLGLIIDGDFYSISTRKKAISIPLSKVLKRIKRSKISTIYVQIENIGNKKFLSQSLENMPLVSVEGTNCIDPIIQFAEHNGYYIENQKHIGDFLEKMNVINTMSSFADEYVTNGFYQIPSYSDNEIKKIILRNLSKE